MATVVVGVVSQKGGVGKSTVSRLIALEYSLAKWNVKIVDLDTSQGTSTDWKKRRDRNNIEPEVAVEPFKTVAQALKIKNLYEMMILDGPPHSMAGTLDIARSSTIVILPTGLSLDDLRPSILLAHELVENNIPINKLLFLLCRVGNRENEIEEARKYINKAGYICLKGSLPEKTAFRRASDEGKALSEVSYLTLKERSKEIVQSITDSIEKMTN